MTAPDSFPTTMTIEKTSNVDGRDGPQWELQVKWPWSNEYPDKVWLALATFEMPNLGAHNVLVHRTGYKKKKDGTYYDGNQGWMFNYKVDSFGGNGPQASPNGHTGAPGSRDDIFRTKEELRWTEALHLASRLTGANPTEEDPRLTRMSLDPVEHTIEMAERLYQALEAGYPHLDQVPSETIPEHFCGEHDEPYVQGKTGAWGHMVGNQPCME